MWEREGRGCTGASGEDNQAGPVVFDEFAHDEGRVVGLESLEVGWRGGY